MILFFVKEGARVRRAFFWWGWQWEFTVGSELKSTSKVVLSILLGFFMTWTSSYAASGAGWQPLFRRPSSYFDPTLGSTSWWGVAFVGVWLMGPALACGAFAAIGIRSAWRTKRVLLLFAITWLVTLTLIGMWDIFRPAGIHPQ
ncbi:hypothetical protein [Duganella sp. Root1480D1]|uniref:hypothetical protein n=1 Tax=Duganella sp. Root1480D1 TaxID=1736471 RepID=UPI00070AD6E8|nr:hypothetical protein [Duganella sp. Root1480D1]KQZ39655.1 hypothetical protein ASD58_04480 [Duganella sp. Root1480D1]